MLNEIINNLLLYKRKLVGGFFTYDSPGQMLTETDFLLKLLKIDTSIKNPLVLLPKTNMALLVGFVLQKNGIEVIINDNAPYLLNQINIFYPELILDVGQSHWKLINNEDKSRKLGFRVTNDIVNKIVYASTCREYFTHFIKYICSCRATEAYFPFKDAIDTLEIPQQIQDLIGDKRYVLLKVENSLHNATAKLIHPSEYVPSIKLLNSLGYRVIQSGREPLPDLFNDFGVLNYANTSLATPLNDAFLFRHCAFSINSGSGAMLFNEIFSKQYISIGSWSPVPSPSNGFRCLPGRLVKLNDGKVLTFSEQMAFLVNNWDPVMGLWDNNKILSGTDILMPNSKDIYDSITDLLNNRILDTATNLHFRSLDITGTWTVSAGTITPSFFDNHPEYLN